MKDFSYPDLAPEQRHIPADPSASVTEPGSLARAIDKRGGSHEHLLASPSAAADLAVGRSVEA
jgi:hypothetical protein